jgi:hypothetical protein
LHGAESVVAKSISRVVARLMTKMDEFNERVALVDALIPRHCAGEGVEQSIYKMVVLMAYGQGCAITEAKEIGMRAALLNDADFEPRYDTALDELPD